MSDGDIAFQPDAPPLDAKYAVYIQRKLNTGQISGEAAYTALRTREPGLTPERLAELLEEGHAK